MKFLSDVKIMEFQSSSADRNMMFHKILSVPSFNSVWLALADDRKIMSLITRKISFFKTLYIRFKMQRIK